MIIPYKDLSTVTKRQPFLVLIDQMKLSIQIKPVR